MKTQLKELTEKVAFLSQEKEALEKEESFEEWWKRQKEIAELEMGEMPELHCNFVLKNMCESSYREAWNHQAKKIDDLRKTVLDFQERYSGALKTIKELEKANDILYSKVLECSNSYYRKAEESRNLIAALKSCLVSVFDHDLEAYLYSPEYQAIKHLLDEK